MIDMESNDIFITNLKITEKENNILQRPVVFNKRDHVWLLKYIKQVKGFSKTTRLLWEYAFKYLIQEDVPLSETLMELNHKKVLK